MNLIELSDVDKATIARIVDELVRDSGLRWIPDWIERQVYTNVITLVMRVLDAVMGRTRIVLFGHEIVMDIVPPGGRGL